MVISLRTEIKLYFAKDIKLIAFCPQIAIIDDTNTDDRCFITQSLILLIFKLYVYKSRGSSNLSYSAFFHKLVIIKDLENGTALRNQIKRHVYKKKCPFI